MGKGKIFLLVGVLILILSIFLLIKADIFNQEPSQPDYEFSSQQIITLNITQQDNFERLLQIDFSRINDTRFLINLKVNETLMADINYCRTLTGIPKLTCFQNIQETYFSDITLQDILDALNNFETFPVTNLTIGIAVELNSLNLSSGSASFYVNLVDYDFDNIQNNVGQRFKIGLHSITIETVESTNDVGWYSSIALDSNGFVHISHYDSTNDDLRYCNNSGGTWTCSIVNATSGDQTAIAIDSNDKVHITSWSNYLTYCNNTLGSWSCSWINGDVNSLYNAIAIDSNDKVHIIYSEGIDVDYCNNTLGTWSCSNSIISTNLQTVNGHYDMSLAIDSNDKVHVTTYNSTASRLMYCNNTLGTWNCTNLDSSTGGETSSIAIDSNGIVHIAFEGGAGSYALRYGNNSGGSWVFTNLESNIGASDIYPSLAIDSNDKVHVMYNDYSKKILKYTTNKNGTWVQTNISTGISNDYLGKPGGRALTIKKGRIVDSTSFSNYVHMSWYNNTNLMYSYININPIVLNILLPQNNTYYNYNTNIPLNFSYVNDSALSTCIYSNDSFVTNTTISNCVNTTFTTSEGVGNITLWINDTSGNSATAIANFTIDTTNPLISFVTMTELNNTNFSRTYIQANVSITETNFKNVTFNLWGQSTNTTTYTDSTRQINWTNLANGLYYYNVTTYDWAGNSNSTGINWIRLDTNAPVITLYDPDPIIYASNLSIPLNFTSIDAVVGVSKCWYKVTNQTDIILNNVSLTNCQNSTFDVPRADTYNFTLYSNDTLNQLNYVFIQFEVDLSGPGISLDYPVDTANLSSSSIYINFTATDSDGISRCDLYSNFTGIWGLNQTFLGVISGTQNYTTKTLSDGYYKWTTWCNDTSNNANWALNNQTFTIDTIYPNVLIESITTTVASQTISFNSSESDTYLKSCKFSIYNLAGGIDGANENISISCNSNPHSATVSGYATYILKVYALDWANNENSTNLSFTTSASSGETILGGGGSSVTMETEDLGYCGDKICNSARGETFYTCPEDCSKLGDVLQNINLDGILFNCIDKKTETKCFWTTNPGWIALFIIIAMIFLFSTLFKLEETRRGTKKLVFVGKWKKKKR